MEWRGRRRASGCRGEGQSGEGAGDCLLPAAGTHFPYPCPLQLMLFHWRTQASMLTKVINRNAEGDPGGSLALDVLCVDVARH